MDTFTNICRTIFAEMAKMPEGAWSFLASLLALTGVFVGIFVQGRHIRTQLAAGKLAQDRDREMSMRKEIYLGAAEAVSAGIRSLGSFADPHLSTESVLGNYIERLPSVSKLYVVAQPRTIQSVGNITGAIDDAILRMTALRLQLLEKQASLTELQRSIKTCSDERNQVFDLLKQHHNGGLHEPEKFERLESTYNFFSAQIKKYADEEPGQIADIFRFRIEMINASRKEYASMIDPLVDALVQIRSELELPITGSNLAEVFRTSLERSGRSLDAYVRNIALAPGSEKPAA